MQLLFDYSAAAFKSAIDIQPDYDFGNNNLGVYYARRGGPGDLNLAEKYFRGALTSNQRYADAYNNLGIVLARQGKFDEAIATISRDWRPQRPGLGPQQSLPRLHAEVRSRYQKGRSRERQGRSR